MAKNPNTFPILTTERLTLRPLAQSDAEAIFQLRSDAEINKYLDRKPSETLADAVNFIKSIIAITEGDALFYWAISKTGEQQLMGTICLFDILDETKKGEIGYELLTEHQGHGFMAEAIKKVIGYANQTLGLKTIDASVHKENQRSVKLLQKMNFKPLDDVQADYPDLILFRLTT